MSFNIKTNCLFTPEANVKRFMSFSESFLRKIIPDSIYGLVMETVWVVIIKVLKVFTSLLLSIYLGRILGSEGLGLVDLSVTILQLLAFFLGSGLSMYIVKEAAILFGENKHKMITSLLRRATMLVIVFAVPLVVLGLLYKESISIFFFDNDSFSEPLFYTLIALVPQGLILIYAGALNGIGKIWLSQLVQDALKVFFVVGLLLVILGLNGVPNLEIVLVAYSSAAFVTLLVAIILLRSQLFNSTVSFKSTRIILISSLPFLLFSATSMLTGSIDVLMLGWLGSSADVGIYSAGSKIALASNFFLTAAIASYGPQVSVDYAQKRYEKIANDYTRIALILGGIGFAFMIVFTVFGKSILNFWGPDFIEGYDTLVILSIGQFSNLWTGVTVVLLAFTGHQILMSRIALVTLMVNVILNYFLIQSMSVTGAAIATAISMVISNILILFAINRKTKVKLSIMGFFGKSNL